MQVVPDVVGAMYRPTYYLIRHSCSKHMTLEPYIHTTATHQSDDEAGVLSELLPRQLADVPAHPPTHHTDARRQSVRWTDQGAADRLDDQQHHQMTASTTSRSRWSLTTRRMPPCWWPWHRPHACCAPR